MDAKVNKLNPTTPLDLALYLSSLAMAKIGPVITLLHPCDQRQDFFNRRRP
jgi:hypothetical protein